MKLTNKQQEERENLEWFSDNGCPKCKGETYPTHTCLRVFGEPSEYKFIEYLAFSERGIPIKGKFNFYLEAKRRRGITIHELWEPSFYSLDGSWPGFDGLIRNNDGKLIPRHIVQFISKEIFRGQDEEKIMSHYDKENNVF